jgi:oligoendopeptidase F
MSDKKKTLKQSRWSLADLYPSGDSKEMEKAVKDLEGRVAAFEKHRSILKKDIKPADFMRVIKDLEWISNLIQRIGGYAELWFTENTQNQSAQTLVARMEQLSAELSNRILFFNLWWKSLNEKAAKSLMKDTGDYRYWLEEIRHSKPYTLSEAEEKIINIKDITGSRALTMLYDSFTNRYMFKLTLDGKEKEVTRGELMTHVRSSDANLRKAAYQELYRVYGNDSPILGQMYQTLARDWRNELLGLRGYKTAISPRNLNNDIPDEVVDTLLEVSQKNAGIFQRFFKLKAKLLGMKKLRRYDI